MRCSIALCASAIASICSSAAAPAAPSPATLEDAAGPGAAVRSAELELELARRPDLYLRIDPAAGTLEVKARRLSLAAIALLDARAFVYHGGDRRPEPPELPARWRVLAAPPGVGREVLEAGELKPYDPESEETTAAVPVAAAPDDEEAAVPPTSYRVSLADGWELRIGTAPARWKVPGRLGLGARRLTAALRGDGFEPPPILALAMAPEDARRLHHLFRPGLEILVVAAPAE